jgi:hypothetical protein
MPQVCLNQNEYPLFSAAGCPLGFRSREATARLLVGDHVRPIYGRKGHLRAIVLPKKDGSHPVEQSPRLSTKFSYRKRLDSRHTIWELRKLGKKNELRPMFMKVVTDCLAKPASTNGASRD